jgi:2-dehydropantoate 2-reductase
MKICIFGAGAIGGYMGAKLAATGADVSLVARGPHLKAMQENGLRLIEETGISTVKVTASDTASDLGPQDYVIVTLKAHSVPSVVPHMQPLINDNTTIVSGVNGVPWWYFHKIGGTLEGTRLQTVDPGNAQWDGFGPDRMLGCVVYPAAEVVEPGVVKHIEGNRFSLGEPDGSKSNRALALSEALSRFRTESTNPAQNSRRNLDKTLGQPLIQSDFRADPVHFGCSLHRPRHPRGCAQNDAGSENCG